MVTLDLLIVTVEVAVFENDVVGLYSIIEDPGIVT